MQSKTIAAAAAACTDVLLPRATTRLVPSAAAPHVHGHHRHRGSGAVAAAANTTDLLSIAAAAVAAYTFSYFLFFLYSFHIVRSTPHSSPSSRQQSSFYSRGANLYTHVLYLLQISSFLNIYRHYIAIKIIIYFYFFLLLLLFQTRLEYYYWIPV